MIQWHRKDWLIEAGIELAAKGPCLYSYTNGLTRSEGDAGVPRMGRRFRINIPGGWYQVTVRRTERRAIYGDERAYAHFLDQLAEESERFRLRIFGKCGGPSRRPRRRNGAGSASTGPRDHRSRGRRRRRGECGAVRMEKEARSAEPGAGSAERKCRMLNVECRILNVQ